MTDHRLWRAVDSMVKPTKFIQHGATVYPHIDILLVDGIISHRILRWGLYFILSFLLLTFHFLPSQDRLVYLALFHGNLFLVSTNSTSPNHPEITEIAKTTETETLNDGAYHTVEITYSPTK